MWPLISLWAICPKGLKAGSVSHVGTLITQLFTTEQDSSQPPKGKASQAPTFKDGWINKIGVGYNGILFNHKKEIILT